MANEAEESRPDPEDEGGPVKPFLEHLEDLRWVLIKCGTALLVGMVACLAGAPQIITVLKWPLENSGVEVTINLFGPLGGVVISMKVALYGGIILSLPFILFFIAQYVMPALKAKEKKYFARAFIIGGGLFMAGVMLCYFVILPISLKGVAQYTKWLGFSIDIWRGEEVFQFVILFMLGMGVSFELPVVLLTLVRLGILQHEWLVKGRRYFFVANLVLCAFITPDFISTFFMVIPVQILMEICILISAYWERQKREAEAALAHNSQVNVTSSD
ncbi:MAG: twin-arginine translocase subunit TatC [Verrucomicrobiota bacterium]